MRSLNNFSFRPKQAIFEQFFKENSLKNSCEHYYSGFKRDSETPVVRMCCFYLYMTTQ